MGKTTTLVKQLADERGYTLEDLADEIDKRGWDIAADGQETMAAIHNPVFHSSPAFTHALEEVLGLSREQADLVFWTFVEEVRAEVPRWLEERR